MLPNFFVVGAQKAGTTSLHHYLSEHPEIYLPKEKETKFFVENNRYVKGISDYEEKYFSEWRGEKAVGEIDPDYMFFEVAIERLAKHFRNPKFIFVFRNPVDRAFSGYLMAYRRGLEKSSFEEALVLEEQRIKQGYFEKLHYSYFQRGLYYRQVSKFLERWDISQMCFLMSEDLMRSPRETLAICCDFLGVSRDFVPAQIGKNFHKATVPRSLGLLDLIQGEGPYRRIRRILRYSIPRPEWRAWVKDQLRALNQKPNDLSLKEDTRLRLAEMYREENQKLAQLINRDLSHWG